MKIKKHKDKIYFLCPGCNQEHVIDKTWEFNGDLEKPTISPSILVSGYRFGEGNEQIPFRCHSFIIDGMIRFKSDCTHDLAGKTVELLKYNDQEI